jgi:hypothetical protein
MTEEQLLSDPYHQLCGDISILPENLSLTWSGLCLAGRIMGENAAREICASICFRNGEDQYRLPELLTVHGWSQHDGPSRMTFFNSRTDHLDRRSSLPALVVTDGVACFLKVLINSEFQRSDIIGVIHRTIERDPLEVIGSRLIGLSQWYAQDSETLEKMLPIPRGISISVLRKRST